MGISFYKLGMRIVSFAAVIIDCLQPSILSYFYSIVERAKGIARELGASAKRKSLGLSRNASPGPLITARRRLGIIWIIQTPANRASTLPDVLPRRVRRFDLVIRK